MMATEVWTIVGCIYLEIYFKTSDIFINFLEFCDHQTSWKNWLFLIHYEVPENKKIGFSQWIYYFNLYVWTFMYIHAFLHNRFNRKVLKKPYFHPEIHNSRGVKTLSNACMCVSVMSYNYEASSDKSLTRHTCQHLINRHQTKTPEDQTNKWIVNRDTYWYRDSFNYFTQET